jgi:hypothetical protein
MRSLMSRIIPLFVPIAALPACGEEAGSPEVGSSQQATSTISGAQTDTATLGQAVHTGRNQVMNLGCVQGRSELRGNSVAELTYQKDMAFNDTLNTLAGGLSVGITLPVVSAEASAKIASKHASTELSETHHLVWVGAAKKEVFVPGSLQLSSQGNFYAFTRADLLEQRCGNEFISEVHRGASFFATMKVGFFNSQDRLEIGGKIKVNVLAGLVKAEGSLDFVDENVKKRTSLSVQVVQNGGRPERILTILPDNIMYCTLEEPTPCLEVFGNLISYARNDFAQQLADVNQYNVLKYVTQSYGDSGIEDLVPSAGYAVVLEAVRQKIAVTEQSLRAAMKDEDRASGLLTTGAAYMTTRQRDRVRDILDQASNNILVYADISRYCYQNLNQNCLSFASTRGADLEAYNPSDLEIKPPIPGDVDEDGCVDNDDYQILSNSYGYPTSGGTGDARADFNRDGWVNFLDYLILNEHWGQGC